MSFFYCLWATLKPVEQTNFFYKDKPVTFVCAENAQKAQTYDIRLYGKIETRFAEFGRHRVTGLKQQEDGWLFEACHKTGGDNYRIFLAGYANTTQDDLFISLKNQIIQGLDHFYDKLQKLKNVISQGHAQICSAFKGEARTLSVYNNGQGLENRPAQTWNVRGNCLNTMHEIWGEAFQWVAQDVKCIPPLFANMMGAPNSPDLPNEVRFGFKMLLMLGNLKFMSTNGGIGMMQTILNASGGTSQKQQNAINNIFGRVGKIASQLNIIDSSSKKFLAYLAKPNDLRSSELATCISNLPPSFREHRGFSFLNNIMTSFQRRDWQQIGYCIIGMILLVLNNMDALSANNASSMDTFLLHTVNDIFSHCKQDLYDLTDTVSFNVETFQTSLDLVEKYLLPGHVHMINSFVPYIQDLRAYIPHLWCVDVNWINDPEYLARIRS